MFRKEDFTIKPLPEFLAFLLVLPFVGLVFPFLMAAYTLGFFMDLVGWLET